jgi:toxin ParE1/3/4
VAHKVVFTDDALDDLQSIFVYVASGSDPATAVVYDQRIREACLRIADFPHRGTPRDDLLSGLRTLSFERRGTIAYQVDGDTVRILGILHHGRDLNRAFGED